MERLYHPYWRHAGNFLAITLLLGAGAALSWLLGLDERIILGLLAVAVTPLLISLGIAIMSLLTERRLHRLQREELYLTWRYDDQQWADYLARNKRDSRWAGPTVGGLMVFVALVFSTIAFFEGQTYFGSVLYTWLLPGGIGILVGALAWAMIRWNQVLTWRAMCKVGGCFLLGPSGFYITGQFRPLVSFGQTLIDLDFQQGDSPDLVFHFYVDSGRYAENQDVQVPVPPEQVVEVQRFLEKIFDCP